MKARPKRKGRDTPQDAPPRKSQLLTSAACAAPRETREPPERVPKR